MSKSNKEKLVARRRRHRRVRRKISGTPKRPRLSVFRSLSHIYAQIIDDTSGRLIGVSSLGLGLGGNIEAAKEVGARLASRSKEMNIGRVVFDRGGYLYHGRVKALAESARKDGLIF